MLTKTIKIIYFLFITALFTFGFSQNRWRVIPMDEVLYRRDVSEIFIMGRLVKSHQDGVFSAGGLLGIGDVPGWAMDSYAMKNQYEKYDKEIDFDTYWTYKSHPGIQGLFYSIFDAWTDIAPSINLLIFRFAISFVLALVFSGICYWFLAEFGWFAAISASFYIFISKWITLLGGNLFWSLWAFYLPMLILSFLLHSVDNRRKFTATFRFTVIVFILALTKILFSGFEFITSSLVMMTVPFVYYAVLDAWKWKDIVLNYLNMGVGLVGSIIAGLLLLGVQVRMDTGNYQSAIAHIVYSLRHRTYGHSALSGDDFKGILDLIGFYLDGYAFSLSTRLSNRFSLIPGVARDLLDGQYLYIVMLFAIATVLFLALHFRSKMLSGYREGLSLVAANWYSILAPLSWLVIFRDHAAAHTSLDFIVWQMPFTLYGFALVGYVMSTIGKLR